MARIRTIKPDAFTSDTLSGVSVLARWLFAGLWTYCDDEGRGRWDPRLIKAALFPLDDTTTLQNVIDAVQELVNADGALCLYEAEGKRYLHVPKWGDHQRISHPTPSKVPPCERHPVPVSGSAPERSGSSPEKLRKAPDALRPEQGTGNREQGNSRAGEAAKRTKSSAGRAERDENWETFYQAYPRHVGKAGARKAWDAALKRGADPAELIAAAVRFGQETAGKEAKFIPHPQTWLNQGRHEDEPDQVATAAADERPRSYFTPTDPPDDVVDDPDAYQAWYDDEVAKHRAAQAESRGLHLKAVGGL